MQKQETPVLIGNTFPSSLFARDAMVHVMTRADIRNVLANAPVCSFWGHESSRSMAEELLGVSLCPSSDRPALTLSGDGLPMLGDTVFRQCYICTPVYRPGYRPGIGEELLPEDIREWRTLRIDWI